MRARSSRCTRSETGGGVGGVVLRKDDQGYRNDDCGCDEEDENDC